MPYKGQKLTDNPKDKYVRVRMDSDTEKKLETIAQKTNSNKSKVIRNGIEIQYNQLEQKK